MEQDDLDKTSKGPPKPVLNDGVQPNYHTPPTTRTQYPNKNAMANVTLLQGTEETNSTNEDDDNQQRIMSSLQAFCTDRFINTTRQIYPITTKMPIAMNHILDESTPHLLDVQSDVCRKLVPVGSIAIDKSLVAGIEVCLQNKLPIIIA